MFGETASVGRCRDDRTLTASGYPLPQKPTLCITAKEYSKEKIGAHDKPFCRKTYPFAQGATAEHSRKCSTLAGTAGSVWYQVFLIRLQ